MGLLIHKLSWRDQAKRDLFIVCDPARDHGEVAYCPPYLATLRDWSREMKSVRWYHVTCKKCHDHKWEKQ